MTYTVSPTNSQDRNILTVGDQLYSSQPLQPGSVSYFANLQNIQEQQSASLLQRYREYLTVSFLQYVSIEGRVPVSPILNIDVSDLGNAIEYKISYENGEEATIQYNINQNSTSVTNTFQPQTVPNAVQTYTFDSVVQYL